MTIGSKSTWSVDIYNRIQNKGIIFSKYTEPLLRTAVKVNGYRIVVNVLKEISARYKSIRKKIHFCIRILFFKKLQI